MDLGRVHMFSIAKKLLFIYPVCLFGLIVSSNYVDKYIDIKTYFFFISFLWFLSKTVFLSLKHWGCWAVVDSEAEFGDAGVMVMGSWVMQSGVRGAVGSRAEKGFGVLGCGGFQGKGVGMVRGSGFRTEGGLGVTGYGGVQGRGVGRDKRV